MNRPLVSLSLTALALASLETAGCAGAQPTPTTEARPAAMTAPLAAAPAVSRFGGKRIAQVLDNTPLVSIRLAFQSGSIDDPKGQEGVTDLTAQLIAEGGTQSLTSAELLQKLFPMATGIDIQIDKEVTVFSATVHKDHLAAFLPILVEVLTAPRWDAKEFERLRDDAVNDLEKRLRAGDDEGLGKEALSQLLWRNHPYGHYERGTVQALKRLTVGDCKAQAQRVFTRDRMVLAVAGPDAIAISGRLEKALLPLPQKGAPLVPLPAVPARAPSALIVEKGAASTALSLGYLFALKRGDPDFYPMVVAASALGEHRQFVGRLMKELRSKRGLNYGDYAYLEHFEQADGSTLPQANVPRRQQDFTIWLRPVASENGLFALREALDVIAEFRKGITQEEFDTIKGFLAGYTLLREQTPQQRLANTIDDLFYGTEDHLAGFRKALETMTLAEVNRAIARWITPEALSLVAVTKNAEELRQQIAGNAATPMTYTSPVDETIRAADERALARPLPFPPVQVTVLPASRLFEE